jgi:hypothetical protein
VQLWHCNESIKTCDSWQALGRVLPEDLAEARLLCHWALKLLSAAADATLEHRPDDSHASTEWLPGHGALVGQVIGTGAQALRLGLRLGDLSLLVLDRSADRIVAEEPLDGGDMAAALDWMSAWIEQVTGARPAARLALRSHDTPAHAADQIFVIGPHGEALEELARWYDNASAVLQEIRADISNTSPVACSPRHFELATRMRLDLDPESGRSIALGLSPGDRYYAEPYWYVSPWPRPDLVERPALDAITGSAWADFGLVLLGSEVVGDGSAHTQESRSLAFLRSALRSSRSLLCG